MFQEASLSWKCCSHPSRAPGSRTYQVLCHLWFVILVTYLLTYSLHLQRKKKKKTECIPPVCSLPFPADFKEKCVKLISVCPWEAAACCWQDPRQTLKRPQTKNGGSCCCTNATNRCSLSTCHNGCRRLNARCWIKDFVSTTKTS